MTTGAGTATKHRDYLTRGPQFVYDPAVTDGHNNSRQTKDDDQLVDRKEDSPRITRFKTVMSGHTCLVVVVYHRVCALFTDDNLIRI